MVEGEAVVVSPLTEEVNMVRDNEKKKTGETPEDIAEARLARRRENEKEKTDAAKAVQASGATPIKNLKLGQKFELDGDIFVIKSLKPEFIVAAKLEWAPGIDFMVERWQRPVPFDTLVVPRD